MSASEEFFIIVAAIITSKVIMFIMTVFFRSIFQSVKKTGEGTK